MKRLSNPLLNCWCQDISLFPVRIHFMVFMMNSPWYKIVRNKKVPNRKKHIQEEKHSSLFLDTQRSVSELWKYAGWIRDATRFMKETFFCPLHKGHIWNISSNHPVRGGMQSRFPGTLTSCSPQGCSVRMSWDLLWLKREPLLPLVHPEGRSHRKWSSDKQTQVLHKSAWAEHFSIHGKAQGMNQYSDSPYQKCGVGSSVNPTHSSNHVSAPTSAFSWVSFGVFPLPLPCSSLFPGQRLQDPLANMDQAGGTGQALDSISWLSTLDPMSLPQFYTGREHGQVWC